VQPRCLGMIIAYRDLFYRRWLFFGAPLRPLDECLVLGRNLVLTAFRASAHDMLSFFWRLEVVGIFSTTTRSPCGGTSLRGMAARFRRLRITIAKLKQ